MKKKTVKVLILSILTIILTSFASSSIVNASTDDTQAQDAYFSAVNSASFDFPITLNVFESSNPDVPKTGSLFTDTNEKISPTSFMLPLTICVIASILAYVVLRQVKTFKQKNSESFGLSTQKTSKILYTIKNPALLLAVCFGFGCAVPAFLLQVSISKADAEEISDLDYDTTNFQTFVDKKQNPYKINVKIDYNNMLKESKSDEEQVEEASNEDDKEEIQKSERKIEDDGEFIVGSVDAVFESYNVTGYDAIFGMKSGVLCDESSSAERLAECVEKTNLVDGENKIPSISEPMKKADFEKLESAAWGWSPDGETYYPLYQVIETEDEYVEYGETQTIYFAVKITKSTPAGAYVSADNFQIYAENNKLTNDLFKNYSITYKNGDDFFVVIDNEHPLFLKSKPGKLTVTSATPETNGECKEFLGWSEKTQVEYDNATDKSAIILYHDGDKITARDNITLNAIWQTTDKNCQKYKIEYNYAFDFPDIDFDPENGAPSYATRKAKEYSNNSTKILNYNDETKKYEESEETFDFAALYSNLIANEEIFTTDTEISYSRPFNVDNIPHLNGYEFEGWIVSNGGEVTAYQYKKDSKTFEVSKEGYVATGIVDSILIKGSTEKPDSGIPVTRVTFSAIWKMKQPTFELNFIENGETTKTITDSDEGLGAWDETNGTDMAHTIYNITKNYNDLKSLGEGYVWSFSENGGEATQKAFNITVDDLKNVNEDNSPRMIVNLYKVSTSS